MRGCPVLSSHSLRLSVTSGAPHQGLFLGDFHGYIVRNSFVSAGGALNWKNWGAGVTVAKLADHNPRLPTKGCPPSQGTTALKQIAIVLFPQRCDCSRLLTSSDFVKVFTSCPLFKFAHFPRLTFAQRLHALVRLIRRLRQRWLLGVRPIWRLRQRWLLGALRVRRCSWIGQWRFERFVCVGSGVVDHDMAPGNGSRGKSGDHPMPSLAATTFQS